MRTWPYRVLYRTFAVYLDSYSYVVFHWLRIVNRGFLNAWTALRNTC